MNKTLTTLLLAALGMASPAMARSSHSAHVALSKAVQRAGIGVYVNHKICDEDNSLGMYIPKHSAVVICQENRIKGSRQVVAWTEEDYDTLRHEVHHVVQDCMDSSYNGVLGSVYKQPVEFGVSVLGESRAIRIANSYQAIGASTHIQVMEIEAFAVAAQNNPAEQIQDINRYCF
jgi:hypothetical protein